MSIACMSQKASKIHKTFVSKLAIVLISNIQSPHEANLSSHEAVAQNHNIKIPDYGTGTIDLRQLLFWYRALSCELTNYESRLNPSDTFAYCGTHNKGWFPLSRNFYVRTRIKFTFANKIEAIHERSLVSVKVEPRSTWRLISTLYILPLFY